MYSEPLKKLDKDIIKWYLQNTATSFESYFVLRNNFIKSLAALAVCHWILGIGDRHLSNLMFSKSSGKIVGIDFGHAFGFGTREQVVPELVPFRLTPQIVNILEPFGVNGLLYRCMCYALQCFRREKDTLLAAMAVFINEPAINWLEDDSQFSSQPDEAVWDPKTRIDISHRKLAGANSLMITLEELKMNRYRNDPKFRGHFVRDYEKIIKGCPSYAEDEDLTVEEQVKVLIAHATDKPLLSLMFSGWRPWI